MSINSDFYKLVFDNTHEGIIVADENCNVIYANRKAIQIHKWQPEMENTEWQSYLTVLESDGVTPTPPTQLPLVRALRGEEIINSYHFIEYINKESLLVKYNAHTVNHEGKKLIVMSVQDCQDLTVSLSRFQAIFDQSPHSMMIMSRHGKLLRVNSAYKRLWGLSTELVNEKIINSHDFFSDPILISQGLNEALSKALNGENVDYPEFYYNPIDVGLPGRARWTNGFIYPLRNSKGEINEAIIIQQDVSEQKFNKIEKIKLQSQLEAILRQLPVGVMVRENDNKVLFHNEAMTRIIGNVSEVNEILKEFKPDSSLNKELSIIRSSGTTTHFTITSGAIRDPDEKTFASVFIATDISEGKRIKSNQEFLARVKNLLISTLDLDQVLEGVTSSIIEYLAEGCMVDVIEGDQINRLTSKHRDPEIQTIMEQLQKIFPSQIKTDTPLLINVTNPDDLKDNCYNDAYLQLINAIQIKSFISVPLQIRGKIIGSINIFNPPHANFFDEADLVLAQELARYAGIAIDNASLFKDTKNAIQLRDDFISVASHELRTPITSLILQIEVLKSIVSDLDPNIDSTLVMRKFLGNTNSQLKRLTRLVDDMLDISRINNRKLSMNIKMVNLNELLKEVMERFDDQLKSYGVRATIIDPAEVIYPCDRERMDQVITNFITNAIKYGNRKPIALRLEDGPSSIYLHVEDKGKGIASQDLERIFNQFERIAPVEDVNGLGLGLYINNHIIREHGGKITVMSEPNQGSVFTVELPKGSGPL